MNGEPRTVRSRFRRSLFVGIVFVAVGAVCTLFILKAWASAPVTINLNSTEQEIDGFGASSAGDVNTLSAGLMDFFYKTEGSGIGLTFIRLKMYPDSPDCEKDEGSGHCVNVSSGPTLSRWDLANAQAAIARGAKVVATEWSPPASMKSSRTFQGGGNFVGGNSNYAVLASIQTAFVALMVETYHVPIYAFSPQNEPDINQPTYPTCNWTARQFHDYVPYLATKLNEAGFPDVKIMISEESKWGNIYDSAAMSDPLVAAKVNILAAHNYGSTVQRLTWKNFANQHIWESEVSDTEPYDGSINSAIKYATEIHQWFTVAGANAWFWWTLDDNQGEGKNCCLTDSKDDPAKRAYAIGNWSKFVRPGWKRVDVGNSSSMLVSAFEGPNKQFAIIAINDGDWPIYNQEFLFTGARSVGHEITPWLTSAGQSLTAQPSLSTANNGNAFTYSIPGKSIITFVGRTD